MVSASIVNEVEERLSNELKQLVVDIQRVGEGPEVLFGELFDDDEVQQHYEGLAATLKAAKKRGIISYKSPILLKGAHDNVMVKLCRDGSNVDLNDLKKSGSSARSKINESVAAPSLEELKARRAKSAAERAPPVPKKVEPAKPKVVEEPEPEEPKVREEPPVKPKEILTESEPVKREAPNDADADLQKFIASSKKGPRSEPEPVNAETPDEVNIDDDLEKFIAAKSEPAKHDQPNIIEKEEPPVSAPVEQDKAPAQTPSEDESVEVISETKQKKVRPVSEPKAPAKETKSKTEPVMGHLELGKDSSPDQSAPKEEESTEDYDSPKKKGRKSLMKKMFSRKSSSGKKKEAGTF